VKEHTEQYHLERNHQGLSNRLNEERQGTVDMDSAVVRDERLEALPLLLLELFFLFFLRRKFGLVGLRLGFFVFAFRHAPRVHLMNP
jgi:hypothetical protein